MLIINSSSQAVGVVRLDINRPTTQQNKEEKNRGRLGLVKSKCESTEKLSLKVKRFVLADMHVHKHSLMHSGTQPHTYTHTQINPEIPS